MARTKKMDETPMRFHLEPELKRWLEGWAHKEHVPVAVVLRKIVRERYARRNSK
jgi:hypothetical protein